MDNWGLGEAVRSGIDGQSVALPLGPAHTPEAVAPADGPSNGTNRSPSIWLVQLPRSSVLAVSIYVRFCPSLLVPYSPVEIEGTWPLRLGVDGQSDARAALCTPHAAGIHGQSAAIALLFQLRDSSCSRAFSQHWPTTPCQWPRGGHISSTLAIFNGSLQAHSGVRITIHANSPASIGTSCWAREDHWQSWRSVSSDRHIAAIRSPRVIAHSAWYSSS
jgi:hypothetical protein